MKFQLLAAARFAVRLGLILSLSLAVTASVWGQVPSTFQDLYSALNSNITNFNAEVGTPPTSPVVYTASLLKADANNGPGLLNTGYWFGLQNQLQALKALGVQGVTVEVGFPMLYAPFFSSVTDYQNYVAFYSQLAYTIHSMGLKLVVENDILLNPSMAAQTWNTSAFYATLTWTQYQQARAQTAAVIAQTMLPEYLVLAEEPGTEASTTGQSAINTPSGLASMVSQEIASVQQSGATGVMLGAGVGTWEQTFQGNAQALAALPLNFLDMHVYETNFNYPANALTIASIAAAANPPLPVTMSECWLHKVRDSEWGVLTQDQIRGRNPFSFWAPLDTFFLQSMQNLANDTRMLFIDAFDSPSLFAYVSYDANSNLSPDQLLSLETQQAGQANQQGAFTSTGMSYYNQVMPAPDTTAPTTPTALTAHNKSSSISWTASTDNVGVAGYHVYRNGAQVGNTAVPNYQDSGLTPGATYTYAVAAFDVAGNVSPQSLAVSLTTPATTPGAPTNLASTAVSCENIKLTWTASTGTSVANYLVFLGTDPASLNQIGAPTGTSYNDFPLTPGTTYFYGVQAVATTTGNVSPMSAIVSVTTPPLPTAPGGLVATPTSATQAGLSWTASTGTFPPAKNYIFRGTAPDGLTQIASVGGAAVSYNDNSLTPGTMYYYAVETVDTAGDASSLSNTVTATTYSLPAAPSGVTATANSAMQIAVNWTGNTTGLGIAKYYIFQGTSPSGLTQVATRAGTTYTDNTVGPSATYYYAVEAVDTAGDVSPMSTVGSATTNASPLPPASLSAAALSDSRNTLTWPAASVPGNGLPVQNYHIFQGTSPTVLSQIAVTTSNSFTDTGLNPGTTYYYGIQTNDTAGDSSGMSPVVSAATYLQPSAPTVSANALITEIDLTWTPSTGSVPIGNYIIFRGTSSTALTRLAATTGTSYQDKGLAPGTTYYYQVEAKDTANDASPMSSMLAVATQPMVISATTISDSSISASWAPPANVSIAHYNVFRGTSASNLSQIAQVTKTSYTDKGLTVATTYYYAEQAVDTSGTVYPISNAASATTYQVPTAPVVTATSPSSTQVRLNWTASTASVPIANYAIFRGTSANSLAPLAVVTTLTYLDNGLQPGATYYYQVQAADSAGDLSPRSSTVSMQTKELPPPTNLTATTVSGTQISLAWTAASSGPSVASYQVYRGASVANLSKVASVAGSVTAYTDAGLAPNTTYYYAVRALDAAGDTSKLSPAASAATYPLPSAPTNLTATPAVSQVALTWTASTSSLAVANYKIFRGASANSLSLVATSLTNSYTNTGLSSGTNYYYAVQAVDTAGDVSPQSTVVSTATLSVVSAPTYVAASATSNHSVLVSWQPATSANSISHYMIYRGESATNLSQIATVGGSQFSYTDNSVSNKTTYYYAIKAEDSQGNFSPLSATASATTPQNNGHGNGNGNGKGNGKGNGNGNGNGNGHGHGHGN